MVIKDKETKQTKIFLTMEELLDYIESKCGEDVKNELVEYFKMKDFEIDDLKETIESLKDKISIMIEDEENE